MPPHSCSHLETTTSLQLSTFISLKDSLVCADCNCHGPNLWICLYKNCLQIGCSENSMDHSTIHNAKNPTHAVHMNLTTHRIWCYECKREVSMDAQSYSYKNDSDQETEGCAVRSRDSGHGSYSTLRTSSPDRGHIFENAVGLNVGMSGDGNATDSSDGEDYNYDANTRPSGLVGLQNIGNTCYMNAALQALSNTEPLTNFFLECGYAVQYLSEGRKPGLSRTYQALIRDIWIKRTNQGYVSPSGILYGIRTVQATFRGYHQHDTQEFLRNFMDQLHEELKQVAPPDISAINDCDSFSLAMDEPGMSSSYDSSEGEYETCDSGVSERSSLSDDTENPTLSAKRRLSRCASPNRRQRQRVQSASVVDVQPCSSSSTNNPKKQSKYRSVISDIFDGKLLSSVQCLTCNRISNRIETFQDLSLPIPSRGHLVVLHGRTISPGATCSDALMPVQDGWIAWILAWLKSWLYGPTISLHDCLAAFFSTDELKGDNMYSCEKCNKLRNGAKFSKVLQLPEVLCIHLKRFRHELMFSSKISSAVSFPLKGLDMRPYLHGDCVSKVSNYELYSVICHHGTAGGGHYTCFALNSGQWYEFDDQYVTKVSAERVQTCEAYVLFYRKVQTSAEPVRSKVNRMTNCAKDVRRTRISSQWINRFYYCAEPGPIDNSDFLCCHGAINPDRELHIEHLSCVVPFEVYDYLHKKFGGCGPLSNSTICHICSAMQKRLLREMEMFVQISRDAQSKSAPHTHYLSTSWYTQWQNFIQKNNQEPPGPIDNTKINCANIDPNEAAEVPECIWHFFYNIYGGGPEIRIEDSAEEDNNNTMTPNYDETEETETMYDFVIPKAKSDKDSTMANSIDKSLYCSGEPMEVDAELNTKTDVKPMVEAPPVDSEVSNNVPASNADDDIDDEETFDNIRKSKRHRRRRKYLLSS